MDSDRDTEVIVVGAGPTGLMLGCELALAGIRTRILERRTDPQPHSRALTLHPRSLELLDLRGLAPRFLAHARTVPGWHFAALPTPLDFSALDTRHGYTLAIAQRRTEQLLEERARELGVRISRGHETTGVGQDPEGVTVSFRGPRGDGRLRARYAVGCDGGRSPVREAAGIGFPGTAETLTGMLGDFAAFGAGQEVLDGLRAAGCLTVPLEDGLHRVVLIDPARMRVPSAEPVTLAEFRASLIRLCGSDLGVGAPRWLSRFGNATRLADRYRSGRILLAGDAAHIHFPASGQGLNTGLQDAVNLGWKLAAAVRGWAPSGLLDSYDHERRPVGRSVTDNTAVQTLLAELVLVPQYAAPAALLRSLLDGLLGLPEVNRLLAGRVSALDTAYGPAGGGPGDADPLVGRRMPDVALTAAGSTVRRVHELFADGRFVLLGLADGPEPAPVVAPHPRLVALSATPGTAHRDLAGVTEVLVRPDGHVAWASRDASPSRRTAARTAAVGAWLGPAPHAAGPAAAAR